jgi:mannose-6-phosphate isomerase-like protein (cupin superfamily)
MTTAAGHRTASGPGEAHVTSPFPSADAYSSQTAHDEPLTVVDLRSRQREVNQSYRNEVLSDVNDDCMRLAVFEGEYRWHRHPDSDELFLVVEGKLQIDLIGMDSLELGEWQYAVVPAGAVHRTRAIGRVVNLTFEKQGARTEFVRVARP